MTNDDLNVIELGLSIRLAADYRKTVTAPNLVLPPVMFSDVTTLIGTNLSYRRYSWLGHNLDRVFFIFGRDRSGNALYLDLDLFDSIVFSADHARKKGHVEARTFNEWFSRQTHVA